MDGEIPPAENWNFGDLLDATATVVPGDRPALIQGSRIICWRDFDARTNRLARAMLASGLGPGDRVAILARNIPEYIEIAAATFKARLSWVNLNYRYTASEIEYVLADCGARAIFFQSEFAPVLGPVRAASGAIVLAIEIGASGAYEALASEGEASPLGIARSANDGYLLYTGGTTGKPKGVIWRAGDARAVQLEAPTVRTRARTMADHVAMVASNPAPGRVVPACPLMHGAGTNSSLAELIGGGTVILLPSPRFDPAELWDECARHGASRVLIVGDVFARPMVAVLRAQPGRWDLSALRVISSAGLMWSKEAKSALVAAIPQVTLVDILGASEASGFGYAITTADHATPTGFFEPGPATVIIDVDTERVLADDEPGEGWLARRPPFAAGYHGDPAKTAATFRTIGDGVYAVPGDMAAREADGRLRLIGRGNMVINTGGEKVFAEEVEESLKRAPGIEDAMVVGAPDPTWGTVIVALVTAVGDFDEVVVRAAMLGELAAYKLPKRIVLRDELPRHPSGKGDYRAAAALARAACG